MNTSMQQRLPLTQPVGLAIAGWVVVTMLLVPGCEGLDYKPNAVGQEAEIAIVIDSARWSGAIGDALREGLSPWIGTLPAPERMFRLIQIPLSSEKSLKRIKGLKNVVFAAPISDSTSEAGFLRAILDEDGKAGISNGISTVIPRHDRWRQHQLVYYVLSATEEEMINVINKSAESMRYGFNAIVRKRVGLDMFEKGRQFDLEQKLKDKHGFAVNVQHDYFIATDTTNFVWLRRTVNSDSWRSVFISWVDDASPNSLTPEWIYEARERLTESWITGNMGGFAAIDFRRELETENIDFLGRFAYETRGLWHMIEHEDNGKQIEYGMGGPFVNYSFYDEATHRIYMIDGMVFAPGFDKREFLRHVEIIAHTFRIEGANSSEPSGNFPLESESTP